MDGICTVLLQNLFSSNVAAPISSRFTHFLFREKSSPKFCLWRKNDKYDACLKVVSQKPQLDYHQLKTRYSNIYKQEAARLMKQADLLWKY